MRVNQDITGRKQAEQELRESEARFRFTLDNMLEGCQIIGFDWRYRYMNDAAARHGRLARAEALGHTMTEIYPGIEGTEMFAALRNCMDERTPCFMENEFAYVDGATGWFELSIQPVLEGVFILSVDITERKHAEQELRESEARFRALAESSPLAVFVNREEKVVLANPAAAKLFGASSPDQLIGKAALDLFDPDSRSLVRERIRVDSETVPLVEVRIVRLDGTPVDVEATASPFLDHGVKAIQVLLRDITERKQAEEELRERTKDLLRSNAELERFAYVASHDLQEPLRMVTNYTQLLQQRYQGKLDADADEFIAYAVDGAARMRTLIDDLLAYSRVGTRGAPFVLTSLDGVLDRVLHGLELALLESGAVVIRDPLPQVWCDPTQIARVFQNLIANAVRFRGTDPPWIHVSARQEGEEWVFSVKDNGIGIDPEYFDRIFVIFQRLQSRVEYEGTGMGLAIGKRILERHDGRIWVESQLGAGSTFHFTLPAELKERE